MIIDSVENLQTYAKEIPLLQEVVKIIHETDFASLEKGSYSTNNDAIRYIIFDYELQKENDTRYEAHRIETDLQIVINGTEKFQIGWTTPVQIVEEYVPASRNQRLIDQGVGSYEELKTFVADRPGHDRRYAINAAKIRNELRWRPT